jgi:hypothetical protein
LPAYAALLFENKTWFVGSSVIAWLNRSMAESHCFAAKAVFPCCFSN